MHVATVQFEPGERVEENRERAASLVREAAGRGADLVVLPEIWNVGYFAFEAYDEKAEAIDGPTLTRMGDLAADLGVHLHAGSVVERRDGDLYNTSVLFAPDGNRLGTYAKLHLFGYDSAEARLLTPGERVVSVETDLGTMGLTTCYDLRFPALFGALVDAGVELLLVASAWPSERVEHWDLLTRTRAMETQTILAAANLCGTNRGVDLAGRSRVVDPWGVVRADAGEQAGVASAHIDLDVVSGTRAEFPVLDDRREDLELHD